MYNESISARLLVGASPSIKTLYNNIEPNDNIGCDNKFITLPLRSDNEEEDDDVELCAFVEVDSIL